MKKRPIFMIHKHQSTHLHYDFRLEIEGKLKSWALREIPIKPSKAILAIKVVDHPFWYRHFEGIIPQGDASTHFTCFGTNVILLREF